MSNLSQARAFDAEAAGAARSMKWAWMALAGVAGLLVAGLVTFYLLLHSRVSKNTQRVVDLEGALRAAEPPLYEVPTATIDTSSVTVEGNGYVQAFASAEAMTFPAMVAGNGKKFAPASTAVSAASISEIEASSVAEIQNLSLNLVSMDPIPAGTYLVTVQAEVVTEVPKPNGWSHSANPTPVMPLETTMAFFLGNTIVAKTTRAGNRPMAYNSSSYTTTVFKDTLRFTRVVRILSGSSAPRLGILGTATGDVTTVTVSSTDYDFDPTRYINPDPSATFISVVPFPNHVTFSIDV